MRKFLALVPVLLLFCATAFGQTRTISGQIRDEKGNAIPNATIQEAGTNNASKADVNGNFSITIKDGSQITVSAVGYAARTFTPGSGNQVISLNMNADQVQETVVVTALGIRRKPASIGYSTASVRPEQITNGRPVNLAQSLSGKVSGLNISNTSASVNAAPRITLRGLRSLTGDNTALIVLDGVPVPSNTINYINPNDVERIDVLKGGQAATLFGSEGVNGAILITTKKGNQRPEITVNHSSNVEKLAYLPKTQHSFGSGSAYGSNREENFHPAENQQFGPRYDGTLRPLGRNLADGSYQLLPYSDISDMREQLWATGYTGQTDVSYRAGDANSSFFTSYQNLVSNGIVDGDKYDRNSLRLNAAKTYGKTNLSFDATYTWDHADRTNTDFYFFALNTASWIPIGTYRDWRTNKFADLNGYFNDYYNNPWWLLDNNRFEDRNNYFNGNVKFTYKPINALELTARIAMANTNSNRTTTANNYTYSDFAKNRAFVNNYNNNYDRYLTGLGRFIARTPIAGSMGESQSFGNRIVADLFATFNKDFGKTSLTAIVGGQATNRRSKAIAVSTNGIGQPDLYNFSNSATGLFSGSNSESLTRKIGGFVDANLGFDGKVFLHGTVRRDYTSVFSGPTIGYTNPTFTTYGGDISIMISELLPSIKGNGVIDNFKIRGGYNKNGNDNLSAYALQTIYPNAAGFPYSGLIGTSVGNTTVNPNLEPEIVKTAEAGFEIGLLKNRISLEGSFYHQKSEKQILAVSISSASGSSTYLLNAADVTNRGMEFDAKVNVVRNKDWNVNISGNYSYNKNKVNSLNASTGLQSLEYQSPDALVSLNAEVGQMFPYLKTTAYERDPQGRIIIDTTDGWPLRGAQRVGQGTTLPVHILGAGINVSWRNITLIANAEYRGGNVVYHDLGTDMTFTGSGAMTTIYEREQFLWPNSVYDNGTKFVPNDRFAVDNYKAIYQGFGDQGFSRGFAGTGELYVSSGAFWKLRDLSIGFELPSSVINRLRAFKGVTLTAWARNVITILPKDNWYTDPEFSNTTGNSTGLNTSLNTPPTRQIGGSISLRF